MKKETAPSEEWDAIEKTAESLHIQIEINGDLPAGLADLPVSGEVRSAIMAAIRECLTNTARHAGGDRLFVLIKCGADAPHGMKVEITNNGRMPLTPVQEAGGLSNLRHMVERAGGNMTIESSPQFLLRLDFKS